MFQSGLSMALLKPVKTLLMFSLFYLIAVMTNVQAASMIHNHFYSKDNDYELIIPKLFHHKNEFLLSFTFRFKHKYQVLYAFLYENRQTKFQGAISEACDFYHGSLLMPEVGGWIAVTVCSGETSNKFVLFASVLFKNGNTFFIRPNLNKTQSKFSFSNHSKFIDSIDLVTDNGIIFKKPASISKAFDFGAHSISKIFSDSQKSTMKLTERDCFIQKVFEKNRKVLQRSVRQVLSKQNRRKSLNKIYTIETIIFVDESLIEQFNGDIRELRKLILAIMNEVQLIYNFDTLKTRIRILIKKIVYLDETRNGDAPDPAHGDIDQYLDNFCAWQKRLWKKTAPNSRWDHALMLTGLDLFKQIGHEKNKKVLGLAWVNGMCRPSYSCTLNEGKNFESAFVIAHELAHSLGMLHDGHDNNCDPDKFIMSEKTGPGKIHWSPCSNLYLENFLKKTNIKCLEKTTSNDQSSPLFYTNSIDSQYEMASSSSTTRHHLLPGQQYSLNQQCQLALGYDYRAYITTKMPFNDICKELWCSRGNWASPAHPALEGSICGVGKICMQGECLNKVQQQSFSDDSFNYDQANQQHKPHDSYVNRHRKPESTTKIGSSTTSSGSKTATPNSFMRKVQTFLRTTIHTIVRWFS